MKTYPDINKQITSFLRLSNTTASALYAADRIEELEAEREQLQKACEAALGNIGMNIMGESCNPELEAMLRAALGKPEVET